MSDNVISISSAKPEETAPALKPLDNHESLMLRHLVRQQEDAKARAQLIVDQAAKEVSDFVIAVLRTVVCRIPSLVSLSRTTRQSISLRSQLLHLLSPQRLLNLNQRANEP